MKLSTISKCRSNVWSSRTKNSGKCSSYNHFRRSWVSGITSPPIFQVISVFQSLVHSHKFFNLHAFDRKTYPASQSTRSRVVKVESFLYHHILAVLFFVISAESKHKQPSRLTVWIYCSWPKDSRYVNRFLVPWHKNIWDYFIEKELW